jgi:hypothetical protein
MAVLVGAAGGSNDAQRFYLYVAGHQVGLGEQQVYAMVVRTTLMMRYRDAAGKIHQKSFVATRSGSLAWTVESLEPDGRPVVGVAVTGSLGLAPQIGRIGGATSGGTSSSSGGSAESAPQAPGVPAVLPSPVLDARGSTTAEVFSPLAGEAAVLSGLSQHPPAPGQTWNGRTAVTLLYGRLMLNLENTVSPESEASPDTLRIDLRGKADFEGHAPWRAGERAVLRGTGEASGVAYLAPGLALPLGMALDTRTQGTMRAGGQVGVFALRADLKLKLVSFVPGFVERPGGMGLVPASGLLGHTDIPNGMLYSTAQPDLVASPAATDTSYVGSPLPRVTPYPSSLPAASLPPIPILVEGVPLASPPPPPAANPTPTFYF